MTEWLNSTELRDLAERRWGPQSTWRCVYCGHSASDGSVDHFIPRERGGTDLPWNLVPACGPCNRSKSAHEPFLWMETVRVPDSTASALRTITRSPDWTRGSAGHRYPSPRPLRLPDAIGLVSPYRSLGPLPRNLGNLFMLDPDEWAPTTALRRLVAAYLEDYDLPPLSTQQLSKLLEARGFVKTKRRGVYGYRGIYVTPEAAGAGRYTAGAQAAAKSRRVARTRRAIESGMNR